MTAPAGVVPSPAEAATSAPVGGVAPGEAPGGRGACACAGHVADGDDARRATGIDAEARARNLTRLRRIEGQVRGLQRMVEEDRYCADVMTQIASVHEALRSVGKELMRNHLRHCATAAIRAGDEEAERMYEELLGLMYRAVR